MFSNFDNWGIVGLFRSRKGTLSLIVLTCATAAVLLGKIDGISYAAIIGTISTIFMWTQHKTDIADLEHRTAVMDNAADNVASDLTDSRQIQANQDQIGMNKDQMDLNKSIADDKSVANKQAIAELKKEIDSIKNE